MNSLSLFKKHSRLEMELEEEEEEEEEGGCKFGDEKRTRSELYQESNTNNGFPKLFSGFLGMSSTENGMLTVNKKRTSSPEVTSCGDNFLLGIMALKKVKINDSNSDTTSTRSFPPCNPEEDFEDINFPNVNSLLKELEMMRRYRKYSATLSPFRLNSFGSSMYLNNAQLPSPLSP